MFDSEKTNADSLIIRVIFDNNPSDDRLAPSWGFSCVIESADKTLLFDTGGDSDIFISNMRKLSIKPENMDMLMISHDHWDHTGGLDSFLKVNNRAEVHLLERFSDGLKSGIKAYNASLVEHKNPQKLLRIYKFSTGYPQHGD